MLSLDNKEPKTYFSSVVLIPIALGMIKAVFSRVMFITLATGISICKNDSLHYIYRCGWGAGVVDPTFVPNSKPDKIPKSHIGHGQGEVSKFCHRFALDRGTQVHHNMVPLVDKSASGDRNKHQLLCSCSYFLAKILFHTSFDDLFHVNSGDT